MAMDALIFNAVADRVENGIFYFAEDNAELEAVLHLAVKTFVTGPLLERLNLLLSEKCASLCLSDQAERNENLRAALIAVHSAVEQEQRPAAKLLEASIRQTISNQCERFSIPEGVLSGVS
jgi:hypothetical protein